MEFDLPENKKIVLFDGVCNLCNGAVQKIICNDHNDVFRFASIQSDIGTKIIDHLRIDISKTDSIILYEPTIAYYIKSEAALKITREFKGFWKLLQVFRILPSAFNDIFYDVIARNRYRWFGKKESCMIPTPALKAKFLV